MRVILMQVKNATVSQIEVFINMLEAGRETVGGVASLAAKLPYAAVSSQRQLAQQIPYASIRSQAVFGKPSQDVLPSNAGQTWLHARSQNLRSLQAAPQEPYFDVNGDGSFNAMDYKLFVQLSVAWTGVYAGGALEWLQRFKQLTKQPTLADWQLQSTDPDFL
jgi:hypothetical protein